MSRPSRFLTSGDDGLPHDSAEALHLLVHEERLISMSARHMTKSQMARELNMPVSRVTFLLDKLKERASLLNSATFQEFQRQELAKLEEVEREAWEQWEESKKPMLVETTNSGVPNDDELSSAFGDDGDLRVTRKEVKITHRDGDPRYLAIVLKSINTRAKLLGADKVNINVFQNIKFGATEPAHIVRGREFLEQLGIVGYDAAGVGDAGGDGAAEPMDTDYTITETSTLPDDD